MPPGQSLLTMTVRLHETERIYENHLVYVQQQDVDAHIHSL